MKTTTLYETLADLGAEFAVVNGWERADYYKPDPDFKETHSFRLNETFDVVAEEVRHVQNAVGIMEVSGFNRYEITGTGVHDWLDGVVCSNVPRKTGKVGLTYLLNDFGNVKGEATIANVDEDTIWYGSAAASEYHDRDWLSERLPEDGSIRLDTLTNTHTILVVAGPKSRDVLQKAAPRNDWSKEAFPWLSVRRVFVGNAEAIAMSVSFSGELAWELHIPNEQLKLAFDTLWQAGQEFDIKPFGLRATESMRIEKGYRHWKADLITEFNPFESTLHRFVKLDKEFIGKDALVKMHNQGPRRIFVSMEIDTDIATVHPGDSIVSDGKVIGTITSAAWGHRVNKNLAMGFVDPQFGETGTKFGVEIIGQTFTATVTDECLYDPGYQKVRN